MPTQMSYPDGLFRAAFGPDLLCCAWPVLGLGPKYAGLYGAGMWACPAAWSMLCVFTARHSDSSSSLALMLAQGPCCWTQTSRLHPGFPMAGTASVPCDLLVGEPISWVLAFSRRLGWCTVAPLPSVGGPPSQGSQGAEPDWTQRHPGSWDPSAGCHRHGTQRPGLRARCA